MPKSLLLQLTNTENEDQLFDYITGTFKDKITTWEYFVNWDKVFRNVQNIEQELNILNYLIGKENIVNEFKGLLKKYPEVISSFPFLIAIRESSIDILIDATTFLYSEFVFRKRRLSESEIDEMAHFFVKSGICSLLQEKKIKNLVDYVTGVEVGFDSNGRKN